MFVVLNKFPRKKYKYFYYYYYFVYTYTLMCLKLVCKLDIKKKIVQQKVNLIELKIEACRKMK